MREIRTSGSMRGEWTEPYRVVLSPTLPKRRWWVLPKMARMRTLFLIQPSPIFIPRGGGVASWPFRF